MAWDSKKSGRSRVSKIDKVNIEVGNVAGIDSRSGPACGSNAFPELCLRLRAGRAFEPAGHVISRERGLEGGHALPSGRLAWGRKEQLPQRERMYV